MLVLFGTAEIHLVALNDTRQFASVALSIHRANLM
jgi:hypothetical protein